MLIWDHTAIRATRVSSKNINFKTTMQFSWKLQFLNKSQAFGTLWKQDNGTSFHENEIVQYSRVCNTVESHNSGQVGRLEIVPYCRIFPYFASSLLTNGHFGHSGCPLFYDFPQSHTVVIDWDFTADFKLDVLAVLTTFQTEFWNKWYIIWKPWCRAVRNWNKIGHGIILKGCHAHLKKKQHFQ